MPTRVAKPVSAHPQADVEQSVLQSEELRRTDRLRLTNERSCLLDRGYHLRAEQERVVVTVVEREIDGVVTGLVPKVLREPRTREAVTIGETDRPRETGATHVELAGATPSSRVDDPCERELRERDVLFGERQRPRGDGWFADRHRRTRPGAEWIERKGQEPRDRARRRLPAFPRGTATDLGGRQNEQERSGGPS